MINQILKEKDRFKHYLSKAGLRFTNGRQVVFDEVMKAHGHFATEALVKQCQHHKRSVSRASVYRYLHELLEAGIIRKTAFGEKHHNYEHVYDEKLHHHARCVRCSNYIEFPDLGEDETYKPILEQQGFQILGHELHFYGICRKCQHN